MAGVPTLGASSERGCSVLVDYDYSSSPTNEIKEALEGGDNEAKAEALKKTIAMMLSGEQIDQAFITIVRYVFRSEDHKVQKLLLLYLELVEKVDSNGKVLPEMILICQNLLNNLQSPNEYLRGATLRFLCRLKEKELLEPLVPSIVQNLEHRHSFVRKNAFLAIGSICKLPDGEALIGDAPDTVLRCLETEHDLATRRNAFMVLCNTAPDKAVQFLTSHLDEVPNWGEVMQTMTLELIRKQCRRAPESKGKYLKIILNLLNTNRTSVLFECASTLIALSSAPTAIRAAVGAYCRILSTASDNNVKLIVLNHLSELKEKHADAMEELLMDILKALRSPSLDIKRKALDIGMHLLSDKKVDEFTATLKKEILRTRSKDFDQASEYRQILIESLHDCAIRFPHTASNVVLPLVDFIGDDNPEVAREVAHFVREVAVTDSKLRGQILDRLCERLDLVQYSVVMTSVLWILGEYSSSYNQVVTALDAIRASLGPTPLKEGHAKESSEEGNEHSLQTPTASSKKPVVLADGTYASQSAAEDEHEGGTYGKGEFAMKLRDMLLSGDFFLAAVVATKMTKLLLKLNSLHQESKEALNRRIAEAMLYMAGMLRMGQSGECTRPIDNDSAERIRMCISLLADPKEELQEALLEDTRGAFSRMLEERAAERKEREDEKHSTAQPDDIIDLHHLKTAQGMSQVELEEEVATDMERAAGSQAKDDKSVQRTVQLTGFSDPVYAEAIMTVHQYDIVLDVTIMNRTQETLQNLALELATMGDLKVIEKPQSYALGPGAEKRIRVNVKVSSTDTGVIFGSIVYDTSGPASSNQVLLNEIHTDILDYIQPAEVSDASFRSMWAEFEWENKVQVNTNFRDLRRLLEHVAEATHMRCLTPSSALDGDCGVMVANFYARSVFGEDALVNLSVEQDASGSLAGYFRIRSKTQGIALSLGDKINAKQRA